MLDPIIIGKVIQQFREEKGLSQEVLSGFADIGRTHLSAIERGTRKPTLETFYRISEAMDVKPSILLNAIDVQKRISKIFQKVKKRHGKIFDANDEIMIFCSRSICRCACSAASASASSG